MTSSCLNQSRDDRKSKTRPRNKHQIIRQIRVYDRSRSIHESQLNIYHDASVSTWRHAFTKSDRRLKGLSKDVNECWPYLNKPLTAQRCSHRLNHWTIEPLNQKSQIAQEYGLLPADTCMAAITISYLSALTNFRGRTSINRTKFTFPWSEFHGNLPRWLGFPMNRTVFRFSPEFELLGFYCSYSLRGVPQSWFFFSF